MKPEAVLQSASVPFHEVAGGAEFVTTCPACGKEDHLYVNTQTGAWQCKKCSKSGGLKDLAEALGVEFGQQDLTDKAVALAAALTPQLREWLEQRGLGSLIGIRRYGYDPAYRHEGTTSPRLTIPYW